MNDDGASKWLVVTFVVVAVLLILFVGFDAVTNIGWMDQSQSGGCS